MTEQEIITMIVDEVKEYWLSQFRNEGDEEQTQLAEEIKKLGNRLQELLPNVPNETADVVNQYVAKSAFLADKDCAFLYVQGMKDCVRILKGLGIL